MKRLLTFLLSLLGFSLATCDRAVEKYGCPYATYEVKGQISDEDKQPLQDIQVVVQQYDTFYTDA
jgi:putative lipoprotein (rSAM/lipoprotein system)